MCYPPTSIPPKDERSSEGTCIGTLTLGTEPIWLYEGSPFDIKPVRDITSFSRCTCTLVHKHTSVNGIVYQVYVYVSTRIVRIPRFKKINQIAKLTSRTN